MQYSIYTLSLTANKYHDYAFPFFFFPFFFFSCSLFYITAVYIYTMRSKFKDEHPFGKFILCAIEIGGIALLIHLYSRKT